MDRELEAIKEAILASGTDDWVNITQITFIAAQVIYGERRMDGYPRHETMAVEQLATLRQEWLARQQRATLPLAIRAVKELIRDGLVWIGHTATSGFSPWEGSSDMLESRIESAAQDATFPLLPGDLFWLENTPKGDVKAGLADLTRPSPPPHP